MSSTPEPTTPLLLLASASAGRRATLERAGIEFDAQAADLDEQGILDRAAEAAGTPLPPAEAVLLLAREKASAVTEDSEGGYVVLGCDSLLEVDGEVLGKPHTSDAARRRWHAQRGRTAVLHTGHWIIADREQGEQGDEGTGATFGATASCEVVFADLSDEEIDAYVATGEPLGVAGAFTIDGCGGPFITSVSGDPHAVVGLSLPLLRTLLAEIGLGIHELWSDS
jgi:septum formation protein